MVLANMGLVSTEKSYMDGDLVGLRASTRFPQVRHCGHGAQGDIFFSQEGGKLMLVGLLLIF